MQEKPLAQQIADMKAQMRTLIEQDPDKVQYTFQVSLALHTWPHLPCPQR